MKILGIVGSMRKNGNTERFVRQALEIAEGKGVRTELLLLRDRKISFCDGCYGCVKTAECKVDDDMQEIYGKLLGADGIILGSPVRFGDVDGLVKTFIDRTVCFVYHLKLKGKVGGGMVVARRRGKEKALSTINHFFLRHGMVVAGLGAMGIGYMKENEIEKDEFAKPEAEALVDQMVALLSVVSGKSLEQYKAAPFSLKTKE